MNYYINSIRRGLGKHLNERLQSAKFTYVGNMSDAEIFFNIKHCKFQQVTMLYEAVEKGVPRIINIGSNSSDGVKNYVHPYAIEKAALDKANEQLFYNGVNTTIIRFGYIDTERVKQVTEPKLSVDYCSDIIFWVLNQTHRVKDLTITP